MILVLLFPPAYPEDPTFRTYASVAMTCITPYDVQRTKFYPLAKKAWFGKGGEGHTLRGAEYYTPWNRRMSIDDVLGPALNGLVYA